MMASPVFRQMLTSGMVEEQSRTIRLPEKDAAELRCFIASLATTTFEPLTNETAIFLSRWAEEYQVQRLKDLCEEHIIKKIKVDGPGLRHAILYNLHKRVAQCVVVMKSAPHTYIDELRDLASPSTIEHMQEFWPIICAQAGIEVFDMPHPAEIRAMWPFLSRAVRCSKKVARLQRLESDVKTWPSGVYVVLPNKPASSPADVLGRTYIRDKLKEHGLYP